MKIDENIEQGFDNTFDRLPPWVRWIIFIPVSIIGYAAIFLIVYITNFITNGSNYVNGLWFGYIRDILAVVIPLYLIHECVPKFKFVIATIFASIYSILGIGLLSINFYLRPLDFGLDYFLYTLLPDIITAVMAIIMIILFARHKFNLK